MAHLHSAHFIKERRIKRGSLGQVWMRANAGATENKMEEGQFPWGLEANAPSSQSC